MKSIFEKSQCFGMNILELKLLPYFYGNVQGEVTRIAEWTSVTVSIAPSLVHYVTISITANIIQFSVVSSVQVYLLDSKLQPLTPLPPCPSFCIVRNLKQYSYVVCLLSPNFGEVDPMVKLTIL